MTVVIATFQLRGPRGPRFLGRPRALGLSLVEVMVSLSIAASLLTAAAVAFNASSSVVQSNDEFFRATQAARISLNQMLTQVRRGVVHADASDGQNLRLTTAPPEGETVGDDLTYRHVPATRKLMLVTNGDTEDPDYVLASNVTALQFQVDTDETSTGIDYVARVSVSMTVTVGGNVVTLSGSAAPRRTLVY